MKSVAECLCTHFCKCSDLHRQTGLVLSWLSCVARGKEETWGGRTCLGIFVKLSKMWKEGNFAKLFQGFAVLLHYAIVLVGLTGVFGVGALYLLLLNPQSWPLLALYLVWVFVDWRTPKQGGRKAAVINFIGALFPFRCMRDYYPITLVKTADLDPERNYIFGYHPHGFMPDGLMISFGTNQLGFERKFPGISPYIGSHSSRYYIFCKTATILTLQAIQISPDWSLYTKISFEFHLSIL